MIFKIPFNRLLLAVLILVAGSGLAAVIAVLVMRANEFLDFRNKPKN